ncbi:MAG: DegT/DnrJ/EryC1/StrS family aminotransferase [Bacteroidetes bacterium]|nr:DegT/DnrJ/EryC1/StrS family aminotransferase [Bacteroidota bacterium]
MRNIPIAKVTFTDDDKRNILKPLDSGWVVQGPYVKEFEEKWSRFTGSNYSIAVSNCTNGLILSLAALGVSAGDEVILPSFTWVATANAIEAVGATPVFCDISLDDFNIDLNLIEDKISNRTKAIIPVHLFGSPVGMDELLNITNKHNLLVIEDAACGFSSVYKGIHVGNFGQTGCFSFHPRKALTTGEGGMVTTNNELLANKLRSMRDHGASISDFQRHNSYKPFLLPEFPNMGYNFRMTDIQASIGSTQMDRAAEIAQGRVNVAAKYDEAFKEIPWLRTPQTKTGNSHGYQAYVCLFEPDIIHTGNLEQISKMRNDFMEYLYNSGISTRPGTHAVHNTIFYRDKYKIESEEYFNSLVAEKCSIALPLYNGMSDENLRYIFSTISSYRIN